MISATAAEKLRLLQAYTEARDRQAHERLVERYMPLVRRLCDTFRRSRESQEDLFQIGVIGL